MTKNADIYLEISGLPVPPAKLAVRSPEDGSHNPEFLAQSPDGMVIRLHLGPPDHDTVGNFKIFRKILIPKAEKIYEVIKSENSSPADAGAWEVEEEFNNTWPSLPELMKDSELWMDAFDQYLFDFLRLMIDPPSSETCYVVQAIARDCTITENGLELFLALREVRPD